MRSVAQEAREKTAFDPRHAGKIPADRAPRTGGNFVAISDRIYRKPGRTVAARYAPMPSRDAFLSGFDRLRARATALSSRKPATSK